MAWFGAQEVETGQSSQRQYLGNSANETVREAMEWGTQRTWACDVQHLSNAMQFLLSLLTDDEV